MIRAAVASDAVAIGKHWAQLVAHHHALDAAMPRATIDGAHLYGRSLSDRLEDSHTQVFVAETEGRVVGYVLGVVVDLLPEMFEQQAGASSQTSTSRRAGAVRVSDVRWWLP